MVNLSTERFADLLAALDSDQMAAAQKYLALRHKLVRVFERLQCGDPDHLADEAIDRIAKKLEREAIHNLNSFAYSVAMKISLETQRTSARFVPIDDDSEHTLAGERDPENRILDGMRYAKTVQCLGRCLQRLNTGDHKLLSEYYKGDKQARILHRQALAQKRETTMARLRSDVNTLREKLRNCVNRCLRSNVKPS
jgi:hypothetical protein